MISEKELDDLLANTAQLIANLHYFDCKLHKLPGSSHRGASITHIDLLERREDFVRELRNTLCAWVHSKPKYKALFDEELVSRGLDIQNAASHIQQLAREKFRKGFPQGQFGELLLFNLIQHFFRAPPILRKMPIGTNPAVERHGADAIHYRRVGDEHRIYIGEAKSYKSKYQFKAALDDAIDSVFAAHKAFLAEESLYVYEGFIDEPLLTVAKAVRRNELKDVKHELVCVVSYEETMSKSAASESEIKAKIEEVLNNRIQSYDAKILSGKDGHIADRIHYFVLPFWGFDDLLKRFED